MNDGALESRVGSPFLAIWSRPREAVRAQLASADPRRFVVGIVFASSVLEAGIVLGFRSVGAGLDIPLAVVQVLLASAVLTWFQLVVPPAFLAWAGRKLGGVGDRAALRCAWGWSLLPDAVAWLLIWPHYFPALELGADAAYGAWAQAVRTFVTALLVAWRMVVLAAGVSAAHRFAIWRAIATMALPAAVVLVRAFARGGLG